MTYTDLYRLSVHAVIMDSDNKALFVKTMYGAKSWTLPGGAVGSNLDESKAPDSGEPGASIPIIQEPVRPIPGYWYPRTGT